MVEDNVLYWIWLADRCGIASKDVPRLCEKYEDPFDLYRMEEEEIERIEGISYSLKTKLFDKSLANAYEILRFCRQKNIDIVSYKDKRYPSRLRNIQDPPAILYVMGKLPDMDNRLCVGVVGTRKISEYGIETSFKVSYDLASANAVAVSGMALGVDGVAACGALTAGGPTVAVLGCGLSVVYPKVHERLMNEIAKKGAVITEYPPFERPHGYNFPKRNRIISGLCQGVLVVEGSAGSGSLITAKCAIEQGREVFALPGKINESNSEGPNELIKSGALVALSANDIVTHYDFLYHDCINYKGLRDAEKSAVNIERALSKYGLSYVYDENEGGRRSAPKAKKRITAEASVSSVNNTAVEPKLAVETTAASNVTEKKERTFDRSAELLAGLDDSSRRVFEALPMDKAVCADALAVEGMSIGEVITALTMLEINGLAESLPGGMYIRK